MASIDDFNKSSYLKRQDFPKPALLTIRSCAAENMAKEGLPEEVKLVAYFEETEKPMVLNFVNREAVAKIADTRDYEAWGGTKIVVYDDPNVSMQGKITGGLRVRAPRVPAKAAPVTAPVGTPPVPPAKPWPEGPYHAPDRADDPKPIGKFIPVLEVPSEEDPF